MRFLADQAAGGADATILEKPEYPPIPAGTLGSNDEFARWLVDYTAKGFYQSLRDDHDGSARRDFEREFKVMIEQDKEPLLLQPAMLPGHFASKEEYIRLAQPHQAKAFLWAQLASVYPPIQLEVFRQTKKMVEQDDEVPPLPDTLSRDFMDEESLKWLIDYQSRAAHWSMIASVHPTACQQVFNRLFHPMQQGKGTATKPLSTHSSGAGVEDMSSSAQSSSSQRSAELGGSPHQAKHGQSESGEFGTSNGNATGGSAVIGGGGDGAEDA